MPGVRWQEYKAWKGKIIAGVRVIKFIERTREACRPLSTGAVVRFKKRTDSVSGKMACCGTDHQITIKALNDLTREGKKACCPKCDRRVINKQGAAYRAALSGQVTEGRISQINSLPKPIRAAALKMVAEHLAACAKIKIKVENFDRVVVEAMEMAKFEARQLPEAEILPIVDRHHVRSFDLSPAAPGES